MGKIFKGTEALTAGLTRAQLRWNYRPVFRDVYIPKAAARSLRINAYSAWLWSGRHGVIGGRAAAAFHGAKWVDDFTPIELIGHLNHPPPGIIVRRERLDDGDVVECDGLPVTSVTRTAFDLARHLPRGLAVAHLDALAHVTGVTEDAVLPLFEAHRGARGVRTGRRALALMDAGAQSPKETWLRLLLIDAGFPRPRTQIPLYENGDPVYYLDMGWEDERIAAEYDGDQHRTNRARYVKDIRRAQFIEQSDWLNIRVVAEDRPPRIISRVQAAFDRRGASRLPPGL